MKKEAIFKLLYLIAILLFLAFIVLVIIDYLRYDPILSSAPFSAYILADAAIFVLLSIIFALLGIVISKRK